MEAPIRKSFIVWAIVLCRLALGIDADASPASGTTPLLNGTYQIEEKVFTLKDGEYSDFDKKTGEGMRISLQPGDIVLGDLTGTGKRGAIVKLAYNTGGMGTFYVIAVLTADGEGYKQVFQVYAGTNYDHITFGLKKDRTIWIKVRNPKGEQTIQFALSRLFA